MDQVRELVPHLKEIADLYQEETFQILNKFLVSSYTQLTAELYSIEYTKKEDVVKAAKLTAQINLLGTLIKLPQIVKTIKEQFDQFEQIKTKQQQAQHDPLNTEKGV